MFESKHQNVQCEHFGWILSAQFCFLSFLLSHPKFLWETEVGRCLGFRDPRSIFGEQQQKGSFSPKRGLFFLSPFFFFYPLYSVLWKNDTIQDIHLRSRGQKSATHTSHPILSYPNMYRVDQLIVPIFFLKKNKLLFEIWVQRILVSS